jgi:hypothetical protein
VTTSTLWYQEHSHHTVESPPAHGTNCPPHCRRVMKQRTYALSAENDPLLGSPYLRYSLVLKYKPPIITAVTHTRWPIISIVCCIWLPKVPGKGAQLFLYVTAFQSRRCGGSNGSACTSWHSIALSSNMDLPAVQREQSKRLLGYYFSIKIEPDQTARRRISAQVLVTSFLYLLQAPDTFPGKVNCCASCSLQDIFVVSCATRLAPYEPDLRPGTF